MGSLPLWCMDFSLVVACGAQLPHHMWPLNSPTRDGTCVPCIGRRILNHWTAKEEPPRHFRSFVLAHVGLCELIYLPQPRASWQIPSHLSSCHLRIPSSEKPVLAPPPGLALAEAHAYTHMSVSPTQTLSPSGSRSGSDSCIPSTQASTSLSAGAAKYLLNR